MFLRGRDLSGHGRLWREALGGALAGHQEGWRQLGIEAVTYLLLVSTLVYLEFAPQLRWEYATTSVGYTTKPSVQATDLVGLPMARGN